jgi:hypothetical protein
MSVWEQRIKDCLAETAAGSVRDEAAIRTALMLGAKFVDVYGTAASPRYFDKHRDSIWTIEGLDYKSSSRAYVAWIYLATYGIGISKDGTPMLLKDMLVNDENDVAQGKSHRERE